MTARSRHAIGVVAWLGLLGTFLAYRVITLEVMEIVQSTAALAAYLAMTFMLDRCARPS